MTYTHFCYAITPIESISTLTATCSHNAVVRMTCYKPLELHDTLQRVFHTIKYTVYEVGLRIKEKQDDVVKGGFRGSAWGVAPPLKFYHV